MCVNVSIVACPDYGPQTAKAALEAVLEPLGGLNCGAAGDEDRRQSKPRRSYETGDRRRNASRPCDRALPHASRTRRRSSWGTAPAAPSPPPGSAASTAARVCA